MTGHTVSLRPRPPNHEGMMPWAEMKDLVADGVDDVIVDANHSRQMWGRRTTHPSFEELGLKVTHTCTHKWVLLTLTLRLKTFILKQAFKIAK